MDCEFSGCVFKKKVHYHCSTCKISLKYLTDVGNLLHYYIFERFRKTMWNSFLNYMIFFQKIILACVILSLPMETKTNTWYPVNLITKIIFLFCDSFNWLMFIDTDNKDSNPSPGDPHLNVRSSKVATSSSNKHHTPGAALEYLSSTTTTNFGNGKIFTIIILMLFIVNHSHRRRMSNPFKCFRNFSTVIFNPFVIFLLAFFLWLYTSWSILNPTRT